jgi:outer membrane murein-binding lipoprotein Lpp
MARRSMLVLGVVALSGVGLISGCCNTGDARLDEVRADPSPNVDTLMQRPADIENAMTVTADENGRMFWEDMGRVWLMDRPSRLSREPHMIP